MDVSDRIKNLLSLINICQIVDFSIYQTNRPGRYCVYHLEGAFYITNPMMNAFLQSLLKYPDRFIDIGSLTDLIKQNGLAIEDALYFLLYEIQILQPIRDQLFKSIYVLSDVSEISSFLVEALSRETPAKLFSINSSTLNFESNSLVIAFASDHREIDFWQLYSDPSYKDIYFITSYLMHHYLVIDNLFCPSKGYPCHYCQFERERYILKSHQRPVDNTFWFSYYKDIINDEEPFVPRLPLTPGRISLIKYHLYEFSKRFLIQQYNSMYTEQVLENQKIDLIDGSVIRSNPTHWDHCSCFSLLG